MTSLAVAGSDRDTARQTNHILPSGRPVPAVFIVRGGFTEHDTGRRQPFRQLARGYLLNPVDLDVAEMRLATSILVQIVDTHRSSLGNLILTRGPSAAIFTIRDPIQQDATRVLRFTSGSALLLSTELGGAQCPTASRKKEQTQVNHRPHGA